MLSHFNVKDNIMHIVTVVGTKAGNYLFDFENGLLNEICKTNNIKVILIDFEDNHILIDHFVESFNFRILALATKGLRRTWLIRVSSVFESEEIDEVWNNNTKEPIVSTLVVRHLAQLRLKTKTNATKHKIQHSSSYTSSYKHCDTNPDDFLQVIKKVKIDLNETREMLKEVDSLAKKTYDFIM